MRWRVVAGIVAVGMGTVVAIARTESPAGIRLTSIPEGVSAHSIDHAPVFLVRHGGEITAFSTDVQHLPGDEHLWWCPSEEQFASPTHGEVFDRQGLVVGGPAQNGLSRFEVQTLKDRVRVDITSVTPGPPRGQVRGGDPSGGEPWDSGQGSFCSGAVKL